jgi:hypothetical protein
MKFEILETVTADQKKKLQDKKVCDVTEMVLPSIIGYYKGWIGSTEEEYFSIVFVKGIITVSLEEREFRLGREPINYSVVDSLHESLIGPITAAKKTTVDLYNTKLYLDDVKLLTFKDVMKSLKWKLDTGVEVEEHYLSEQL